MRVAFITVGDTTRLTGGYLYHARVFAGLRAQGIDLVEIVAASASREQQAAEAEAFGQQFAPEAYDVIVVDALARTACAPHLDAWRARRPLVAMVHELPSVVEGTPADQADEAPLLRADLLIAVSRHGAGILEARGVAPERIHVVSPGRDRLDPTSHMPRPTAHVALVLSVAQWVPRKGIETLVAAWTRRGVRQGQLLLVGDTDADPLYAAKVQARIATANDASIETIGLLDDHALQAAYAAADLFVLPSRYEGYGMAYAEALEFGLPVIACNVGPLPELLGDAALLVEPDNPAALADAMDSLLQDVGLRATLAGRARVRAAALPTWAHATAQFKHVLEMAVQSAIDYGAARTRGAEEG